MLKWLLLGALTWFGQGFGDPIRYSRMSCKEAIFFETVDKRFEFFKTLEPGWYKGFEATGDRAYKYLKGETSCVGTHCPKMLRNTNCLVDLPLDDEILASEGVGKINVDHQWFDDKRVLHHEGYQVAFSFSLRNRNDPKTIWLRAVDSFTICRTRETCTKMVRDSTGENPAPRLWMLIQ